MVALQPLSIVSCISVRRSPVDQKAARLGIAHIRDEANSKTSRSVHNGDLALLIRAEFDPIIYFL